MVSIENKSRIARLIMKNTKKYLLYDNDIVIARTGATAGKSYLFFVSSVFSSREKGGEKIKGDCNSFPLPACCR